jgi:hypothetical protein
MHDEERLFLKHQIWKIELRLLSPGKFPVGRLPAFAARIKEALCDSHPYAPEKPVGIRFGENLQVFVGIMSLRTLSAHPNAAPIPTRTSPAA